MRSRAKRSPRKATVAQYVTHGAKTRLALRAQRAGSPVTRGSAGERSDAERPWGQSTAARSSQALASRVATLSPPKRRSCCRHPVRPRTTQLCRSADRSGRSPTRDETIMKQPTPLAATALGPLLALCAACGTARRGHADETTSTGAATNIGGTDTGGEPTGGTSMAGTGAGGKATGGGTSTGGTATGGTGPAGGTTATGGEATAGASTGGTATGGSATGGTANVGGTPSGGGTTGAAGIDTGGEAAGGTSGEATGGTSEGGTTGAAGSGGAAGAGGTDGGDSGAAGATGTTTVVINFDDLTLATKVTTQYADHATFSCPSGDIVALNTAVVQSPPNFICGTLTCTGAMILEFARPVSGIHFTVIGVNATGKVADIVLYEPGGSSATVDLVGQGNANLPVPVDVSSYSNVTRLEITNITDLSGLGADDFTFQFPG
jgi:hypothetical protein